MTTVVVDVVCVIAGLGLVVLALDSAVRTFLLPRGARVPLTRAVWIVVRMLFDARLRFARTYERRDAVMALYAPIALLAMLAAWLLVAGIGFMLLFYAAGVRPWSETIATSGSSLFTLGFDRPSNAPGVGLSFAEAGIGLLLLAVLIGYLPAIYSAFSQRELAVARLAVWAGTPPSVSEIIVRAYRIEGIEALDRTWREWREWFASIEETHTSMAALPFLRSPRSDRSWVTAAGAVLDSAGFRLAVLDQPWEPQAALCIRSGYLALNEIADNFRLPVNHDPAPTDPVSIAREEWDEVLVQLEAEGVALKADRDQAWADWCGWRVNYESALLAIAGLVAAPYAPWSSDRSLRLTLLRRRHRRQ